MLNGSVTRDGEVRKSESKRKVLKFAFKCTIKEENHYLQRNMFWSLQIVTYSRSILSFYVTCIIFFQKNFW